MANRTALSLMRMALALYDRDGEGGSLAACHLQAAVDAATLAEAEPSRDVDREILGAFDGEAAERVS